jgi:thioredoxin-related protein
MNILLSLMALVVYNLLPWETNFEQAKKDAAVSHRLILLNFSGSDWCAPCKRMKSEIFEQETFNQYAEGKLVLLAADFPRLKKNALDKAQTEHNERLAERYNPTGKFPLTVLLDSTGQVLKVWEGYPKGGAEAFLRDLSDLKP